MNLSLVRKISGFVLVLGVWQILASTEVINPVLMPAPSSLLTAAYDLIREGSLQVHVLASLKRVVNGFLLAALCGIVLGIMLGWSKTISDFIRPIIESLRPIPPIAWTPMAILWFGVGDAPSYFLVFIGAVFPIFVNTFALCPAIGIRRFGAMPSLPDRGE